MRRLVALDLPPGKDFVEAMRRCFDDGDAVLPVDQRLGTTARATLFSELAPAVIVGPGNEISERRRTSQPIEDGDAFVVGTSGTTGVPRGVVLTHEAVRSSAIATSTRLGVEPTTDHWLCCLPVAHVGGLSVITRALALGTKLTVLDRFTTDGVLAAARDGATLTSLVITALFRLGESASAFRAILLGGSQIPSDRPPNTVATYGMTETGSGIVYDGLPLEGVDVTVNGEGEIFLRGPMLLRAYRDGVDPKDHDGWLATGDGGRFDDKGSLCVDGRLADVIVTGGEKVWPTEVEAILARSPKIDEVAVFGAKDDEWGERVVACIVANDEHDLPSLDELRSLVRDELGGYYAPRELVFVASLPKTTLGKVRRKQLADVHHKVDA